MSKSTKPSPRLAVPGRPAPIKPENLTEEQKRDLLIKQAQQKLYAVTEGVIFNLVQSPNLVKVFGPSGTNQLRTPEEVVDYASGIAEAYVKKAYGVEFHVKEEADPNDIAPAK